MGPWRNSYLNSSALDDPLDNPVLQRDSARDLAVVLADRNDAALALHQPLWGNLSWRADFCRECDDGYPCATVRALTGTDSPEVA